MRLESGDRLTRFEFHRRYEAMPNLKYAELVEGVVYLASPLRARYHGEPENSLGTWLGAYRASHPGLHVAHNSTLILDSDNEFQPDLCMWRDGGSARFDAEGFIEGAPELVAEIAASSVSLDLHQKKHVYRRHEVREYIVWRVLEGALDWFVLIDGEFQLLLPGPGGVIESREFPGLRLNTAALLAGDMAGVLASLAGE